MNRNTIALAVMLLAACEEAPFDAAISKPNYNHAARTFEFTTIDVPGARAITAFGISPSGAVVGTYTDQNFVVRGFLRRKDELITINYPGAAGTQARGINPAGEIVGSYWMEGEPAVNLHGFLRRRDGTFVPVDYPGHINTIAQRILPNGTILGCRHDNDMMASMVGIVMTREEKWEIDAFGSMNNGATPDLRRIVGLYTNMMTGQGEGYVIDRGEFKPFMVPGSISTAGWDINARGEVVGVYRDAVGFHGFLRTSENDYITIDVPGATTTRAFGVNPRGDVVGNYVANGKTFGFIAHAVPR
jgi:uncharacterized membrane protein